MKKQQLSIYVHIPFCMQKCRYCDFLSAPADDSTKERYVNRLCHEIANESKALNEYEVDTVFFGGGTPTVLSGEMLERILNEIYVNYCVSEDAEISIECNPGTADYDKLCKLKKAGFNRLSIGLQSVHDEELAVLGRIHTYAQFEACYADARKAGFDNINIDLMSALPGQSLTSYGACLEKVISLRPEHISAYSLIIEEGTPFYEQYADHPERLPDEETDRAMYECTRKRLLEAGYERYEISNYSLPGLECRHNLVYWRRGQYRGFGIGAASLIGETRFSNVDDFEVYINNTHIKRDMQVLTQQEQMEEFMFLGLRCTKGVCAQVFERLFGQRMEAVYGQVIEYYVNLKLMVCVQEKEETWYRLTNAGIDVSNEIFASFLLS